MKKMRFNFLNRSKLDLSNSYGSNDNLIDVSQKQFMKQQEQFFDLQNHLRAFIKGVMNITETIENMYNCFKGIYEPHWLGNLEFNKICQESIKIWRQFTADFKCNISKAVDDYGQQFPDMKRSIDRRNKKLNELSKQRKLYESLRNAKKVDDNKVKRVKIELDNIDQDYQSQNNALKESLPNFCDKRLQIYIELWTKLFEAEEAMFSYLHQGRKNQLVVLSKLSNVAAADEYSIKSQINFGHESDTNLISTKAYAKSAMTLFSSDCTHSDLLPMELKSSKYLNSPDHPSPSNVIELEEDFQSERAKSYKMNNRTTSIVSDNSKNMYNSYSSDKVNLTKRISFTQSSDIKMAPVEKINNLKSSKVTYPEVMYEGASDVDGYDNDDSTYATIQKDDKLSLQNKDVLRTSIVYDTIPDNPYYYQVKAVFNYNGQDEDELSLKRDDIILVLPWNDEEQMEDGWLFGENILSKKKGLFPENHTTKFDS